MSIHAALHHRTVYRYDRPARLSPQVVRLRPAPHCRTKVEAYSLRVLPKPHFLNWLQDPQGNWQARVVFPEKVTEFSVEVDLVADMAVYNPFDFFVEDSAERFPFEYEPRLKEELKPFLRPAAAGRRLGAFLQRVDRRPRRTVDFLVDLNRLVANEIRYLIRLEPGVQTPEDSLRLKSGSCRDSGWLLVQCLRQLGLAARFVSGYLIQLRPDVKSLDGPSGAEADFTDLHAWAECYVPGAGWIGLDPTSGLLAGEGHIPLCATPEPQSAAPVSGSVDECEVEFAHEMRVTRVRETPRVTRPYTEEQWAAVDRLGHAVDARLCAGDVRLTMGGEPTFVSIDDYDGAEWNTAAVGPAKQRLAQELIERLRRRHAPQGLLHFGQGKWYPSESLPRWAYGLYWRKDGQPILREPAAAAVAAPTVEAAGAFLRALAERLGVDPGHALPAYEDHWYYLHRERLLPANVDALDNKLANAEERARLAQVFERGLQTPRGYVLPVQRWNDRDRRGWISERWSLRQGRLLLIPGDSPLGLRLPLESLPWLPEAERTDAIPADPMRGFPPLPQRQVASPKAQASGNRDSQYRQRLDTAPPTVRTALAAEPRDGHLCVFMPPTQTAEDYLDLLAAVEDTAAALRLPVRIEGYTPPYDPRLEHIKVTPDPGVIEVNVQPVESWDALKSSVFTLYEEARLARLGTEKFLIDGRATGTGGGNHIVVGGATPADSPFLRRPDLLGSLLRYWQNHPSLSYLFSVLFIGPTSQAPRIDEARNDSLYELEIALRQLPRRGTPCPPWAVDRALRHILTDVTGNTHRTEICIDKLYSPDSATGRLGLVEFRSFEMPPHAQMSLTQQLLLRALIARFWDAPYEKPPIRWGSALHDRYLLPHFVEQDFREVLAELADTGLPFDPAWFAAHFEFRFPLHGAVAYRGITLELRHALEPWLVLGEEPGAGGTARYVDSSVERVQLKVGGLAEPRYAVCCNGRLLPLTPTGVAGEHVAGVRFRAWQPWSCLHPSLPANTPLVFDLVDRYSGRALGGCTYHVAHPGGRAYDRFPVNAFEAESRRLARFQPFGHTPGPFEAQPEPPNPDFPCTLDLRRG
ncbi:MAG: transglutaminase family protein [Gammaproteobacteria bacterium]|nr:transglutaminase family protein [Gammaproteobacteria bacterium]